MRRKSILLFRPERPAIFRVSRLYDTKQSGFWKLDVFRRSSDFCSESCRGGRYIPAQLTRKNAAQCRFLRARSNVICGRFWRTAINASAGLWGLQFRFFRIGPDVFGADCL